MNEKDVLIEKAKGAKSVEDLLEIAKANGIHIERETAEFYFKKLNPPQGEMTDDEISSVTGGGCSKIHGSFDFDTKSNELYTGRKIYLKNEGHCAGASANYQPSTLCLNPKCRYHVFSIIKQTDDADTYLIGCYNCDWTYWAKKENIVPL